MTQTAKTESTLTEPGATDQTLPWAKYAVAESFAMRYFLLTAVWFIGLLFPYANLVIVIVVFLYQAKLLVNAKILIGDPSGSAYIYGLFSLVPGIGIMLMLGIHNGAIAALKECGVPVGLLGVSKANLQLAKVALAKTSP
jgi:hypothetical protein